MLESFVLRLIPSGLAAGVVVGEVQHVASGRQQAVRDIEELVRFLQRFVPVTTEETDGEHED